MIENNFGLTARIKAENVTLPVTAIFLKNQKISTVVVFRPPSAENGNKFGFDEVELMMMEV